MRKIIFTLIILIPTILNGQDWAPIGAKWIYDHDDGIGKYLTVIESIKDTVILDKECRTLIAKEIDEKMRSNGFYYWDTVTISKDFIYYSNDTVFHYNKDDKSFYPLYILNVKGHDTILVRDKKTPCNQDVYFCSRFEYVIDSISSISLQGHTLKVIYNSETQSSDWMFNRSWNNENYPIIEQIGSLKYLFGVGKYFVMEGAISKLRCYSDNQISYKASDWANECDYLRPLHEPLRYIDNKSTDISIFPNPFESYIKINIENAIKYELYDSFGKLLLTGNDKVIRTDLLKNGIYILRLMVDKKSIKTIKIIKHLP